MTPQEIIKEIQNLPPTQKREFLDNISKTFQQETSANEEKVEQLLFEQGIIGEPSNLDEYDEDDFEPIEIEGEPLSETIIKERR